MPTENVINTTLLRVKVDGNAIARANDASISFTHDTRDITTKDSGGYRELLEGLRSAEASTSGLYAYDDTNGGDSLFADLKGRNQVEIEFTTDETGDTVYTVDAYITSLELNSSGQEDNAGYSASFACTGEFTSSTVS